MKCSLLAICITFLLPSCLGAPSAGPIVSPDTDGLVFEWQSHGPADEDTCTGEFSASVDVSPEAVAGVLRIRVRDDCTLEIESATVGAEGALPAIKAGGARDGASAYPVTYYRRVWHEVASGDWTGPNVRTYQLGEWSYDRSRVYSYRTAYTQCEDYGSWDATCRHYAESWGSNAARFMTTLTASNSFGHYLDNAYSKTYVNMNGYVYTHSCNAGSYALRSGGYVECRWNYG